MYCYIDQMGLEILGLLVVVVLLAVAIPFAATYGPVPRRRVRVFARLHRLPITADNGGAVIGYLALTRRWRVAGMLVAIVAVTAYNLTRDSVGLNVLTLFAGWFVGAIIAEARLVRRPTGAIRSATLAPRTADRYVGRFLWSLPDAALLLSAAIAVLTAIVAGPGSLVGWAPLAGLGGAALAVGVVHLTRRAVIERAQLPLPPDQLAADDAIRSRSIHVLCASGATVALYGVLYQLGPIAATATPGSTAAHWFGGIAVIGTIAIPALGWNLATSRWSVPETRIAAAGPAAA
jgi:hypothetical protein